MAGVRKRGRANRASAQQVQAAIEQAQFMVGIYAEIVAMDQTIIERVRMLLTAPADVVDAEAYMSTLRDVVGQLKRVGERIGYWNARTIELLEGQFAG
jgi:predicted translin family RNA/ssDNA-binding protein